MRSSQMEFPLLSLPDNLIVTESTRWLPAKADFLLPIYGLLLISIVQ